MVIKLYTGINEKLKNILVQIADCRSKTFSGIGFVVYDSISFDHTCHMDLRPKNGCPTGLHIDSPDCVSYFLEISSILNPLHDGFNFINELGVLTSVAQYFVPPIVDGINPNENYGVRYQSAILGSIARGVISTGVVSSNGNAFVFERGSCVHSSDW